MNKKHTIIAVLLVITAALAGCSKSDDSAGLPTGTIEAREIDVNTKIPGRVLEINTEEGKQVNTGDILVKIDDEDVKAKKDQAEAKMKAARAQLQAAQTGLETKKQTVNSGIESAEAALKRYRAEAEMASKTLKRMEKLFEQGAVTRQELDEARTKANAKKAAVEEAQAKLEEARSARLQIELARDEAEAAQAQYEQARAALEEAENNLEETKIDSPAAGTVTEINVEEGELVSSGLPLITITDFENNWVEMQVNQNKASALEYGQKATIIAAGEKYEGEITKIAEKPTFATRRATNDRGDKDIITYEVHIRLDEPSLRPGMNVEVEFNNTGGGVNNAS